MAKSRSTSPSKAKAAKASGPVSATVALTATLAWFMLVALVGLVLPKTLMAGYQIPLDKFDDKTQETLVTVMFQNWMTWMMMGVGMMSIVRRVGDDKTKGLACLTNVITMSTFLLVGEWKHNAMWLEMGMPDISVNFNRVLFLGYIVLNFLGWQSSGSPTPDLSLLKAVDTPAFQYSIVLSSLFGLMMIFNIDELFAQYNFSGGDGFQKQWIYAIFTGMGQTLLTNAVGLACMLSGDKKSVAQINRFLWAFYTMQMAVNAVVSTSMVNLLAPSIDANMQIFNTVLWLVGMLLAWKTMIDSD